MIRFAAIAAAVVASLTGCAASADPPTVSAPPTSATGSPAGDPVPAAGAFGTSVDLGSVGATVTIGAPKRFSKTTKAPGMAAGAVNILIPVTLTNTLADSQDVYADLEAYAGSEPVECSSFTEFVGGEFTRPQISADNEVPAGATIKGQSGFSCKAPRGAKLAVAVSVSSSAYSVSDDALFMGTLP